MRKSIAVVVMLLAALGGTSAAQTPRADEDNIFKAVLREDVEAVKRFIKADPSSVKDWNKNGGQPLHLAAEFGKTKVVKTLVENGADIEVGVKESGNSPLMLAADAGNLEMTRMLVTMGAKVNAQSEPWKETPLMLAASHANEAVVNYLLEKGADVKAANKQGRTALHYLAGALLGPGADRSSVPRIGALFIAKGALVDAKDENGQTPLYIAFQVAYHMDLIELLLAKGADINTTDNGGVSILQIEAQLSMYRGDRVTKFLLAHGARQDVFTMIAQGDVAALEKTLAVDPKQAQARNPQKETLLHVAAQRGNLEAAKVLIKRGADIEAQDMFQETPLVKAVKFKKTGMMNFLVEKGANATWRQPKDGNSLIIYGAQDEEILRILLDAGADINAANAVGDTALHLVAAFGDAGIVKRLLNYGADPSIRNQKGKTAMEVAVANNREEVVGVLQAPSPEGDFLTAVDKGDLIAVRKALKEKPALLKARNALGQTALHRALAGQKEKTAELLIEMGAEVSARDKEERTPLHVALNMGEEEIALLLIEKGSDIRAVSKIRNTPLHTAAIRGEAKAAAALIAKGAPINEKGAGEYTPLIPAAMVGHVEVVKLLLEHGADTEARDWMKKTALHDAAWNGHEDVVRLLVAKKADINAKDQDGRTPLFQLFRQAGDYVDGHRAAEKQDESMVAVLIELGADVNTKDNIGLTPLNVARSMKWTPMVELLMKHGAKE